MRYLFLPSLAMVAVVASSNYLVQFPINDWLTFGAFPYPLSFFVTEVTNWFYGPERARKIVYLGFAVAIGISLFLATPQIAFASSFAFLISQLLDITVFSKLKNQAWWKAPFVASTIASLVDTSLFWSLAFWGENLPIFTWALGDFLVKVAMDTLLLAPFRVIFKTYRKRENFLGVS